MRQTPMSNFAPGIHTGSLAALRAPKPAGASAIERPSAPAITAQQWMHWSAAQRSSYMKSIYQIKRGESVEAYARRIRGLVVRMTTDAVKAQGGIRPAGAIAGPDPYGIGMLTGYATPGDMDPTNASTDKLQPADGSGSGSGGSSGTSLNSLATAGAQVLGLAAQTVAGIFNSNNQVEIARIQADSRQRIAELQAQSQQSQVQSDPAQQSAIQQQIAALQALMAAAQQRTGLSPTAMIAIGVAAVAVLGGAAFMMMSNRRRNPVIRRGGKHVAFVSARYLRTHKK